VKSGLATLVTKKTLKSSKIQLETRFDNAIMEHYSKYLLTATAACQTFIHTGGGGAVTRFDNIYSPYVKV
jgi:hypothetical protein